MPRCPPASSPCAITASTPRASSQRASSTVVADDRIFVPQRFTRAICGSERQPEMKADHRRLELLEQVRRLVAVRQPAGSGLNHALIDAEFSVVRRQHLAPRRFARLVRWRLPVNEEVDVVGLRGGRGDRGKLLANLIDRQRRARQ